MSAPRLMLADWPAPPGVLAFTTQRHGGVSQVPYDSFNLALHVGDDERAVAENRRRLLHLLPPDQTVQWLHQVHGTQVAETVDVNVVPEADAAIVRKPGAAAAVMTADCLPVFMLAADAGCAAVVHAGWRGLQAGVIEAALRRMAAPPADIMVWLGPAIGPCHFEVGDEVRVAFLAAVGASATAVEEVEAAFRPASGGKWMADLYALARTRLRQCGVTAVYGGGVCTYCDNNFYSYRRDGRTGRMASLICLNGLARHA